MSQSQGSPTGGGNPQNRPATSQAPAGQRPSGAPQGQKPLTNPPPKKRRGGCGLQIVLLIFVIGAIAVFGFGYFAPMRLAIAQEQVLGLLHGGVAGSDEQRFVDGCIQTAEGPRAITRTRREIRFNDGSIFVLVFSEPPVATNC